MAWRRRSSGSRNDQDHADEMQAHLDLLTEQLIAQGRSPGDARREARLKFGNPNVKLEQAHDRRWSRIVDVIRADVRTAARGLRATPGFTVVVLTVLALAMSALTAVFALVDGVMLRPLPFDQADRLVAVGRIWREAASLSPFSATEFLGLRARHDVFAGLAATTVTDVILRRDGDRPAEILRGQRVSAEFFDVLRARPALGRAFSVDNEIDGRHLVAVISHGLWQRRFGGRQDVVGSTLATSTGTVEVIGVMDRNFEYPVAAARPTELWMPYVVPESERVGRTSIYLQLVGRLRDGVTLAAADAAGLTETAEASIGTQSWKSGPIALMDLQSSQSFWVRQWMWMLLAAVACVLVLAAINVANLLVVRATVRSREWALRLALGATFWNVLRLLLVESLLLALLGAAVGLFTGWIGLELVRALLPSSLPRVAGVIVDIRTVAVVVTVATAIGLLGSLAPLWQAARGVRVALVQGGRSLTASRERVALRAGLLVAEVALAVVLVLAGGMFLVSFSHVTHVDLGIDAQNVLVAPVRPGAQGLHKGTAASGLVRLEELTRRVRALPSVETVALVADNVPFSGITSSRSVRVPSREAAGHTEELDGRVTRVSPEYFALLKLKLLRGRVLDASDNESAPAVVVLSEAAARTYFPDRDALGEIVDTGRPLRVVGVVADVRDSGPEAEANVTGQVVYVPLAQSPSPGAEMLVRVSHGASTVTTALTAAVRGAYPEMAVPAPRWLADDLHRYVEERQFNMIVIGIFALLGIAVACVGVHGVSAYIVTQRTKEIGIRRALGGGAAAVVWAVLRGTSVQVAAGVALGLAAALYLSAFAREFLFQIDPRDPWLYAASALVLTTCALLAAASPARRAARVDPAVVLRLD